MYLDLHSETCSPLPPPLHTIRPYGTVTRSVEEHLRICMLVACPFPANHGTPGSIREMAEAIAERGHEVHIVTYQMGEDIPVRGPRIHRIKPLTRESKVIVGPTLRRPLYDLQLIFKALEVIRKHHLHVIHAHGYEAALAAWLCRAATGLPVLYSGHNTMEDELPSYRFIWPQLLAQAVARFLDTIIPRLADRCLPHSTNIYRFFCRKGLSARTEPVVNFGIDMDWIPSGDGSETRRKYGLGSGPAILYSGVFNDFQRLDLLLEAMKHILRYEPKAQLHLVETIPHEHQREAVLRQARQLKIADHLILTGPCAFQCVRECLQACDVAVVPRPGAPGFPIKLLNYMAAKKPCVLFASSANNGLCHRENVLLAAPDTSQALGEAVLELLRDRELRQRIAHNGYTFVREYHDRRLIAQEVCAVYTRVLRACGRSM